MKYKNKQNDINEITKINKKLFLESESSLHHQ